MNGRVFDRWNSAAGKARLWEVVAECIRDKIMRCAAPDTTYVVDPPAGDVWSCPPGVIRNHNYGEADAKCSEAALALAEQHPNNTVNNNTIQLWSMELISTGT